MSGTNVVASMVVFTNGVSDRGNYRKFKMHRQRNDDVANMRETLERRCSVKNIQAWGLPDVILVDGGKGQLRAVIETLRAANLSVPAIGIAKREEELIIAKSGSLLNDGFLRQLQQHHQPGIAVLEEKDYFIVNLHVGRLNASGHSRNLRGGDANGPYDELLKLFQRIRDESHRFAVSYHTVLKRASATKSALDDVPGVGPVTRKKLLKQFGSVKAITDASEAELAIVVGPVLAHRLRLTLG
jgi:excinuclease ABC subunit C